MAASEATSRIMVVDDSPDNREAVVDMLRALNYTVECANNGREALALLTTFKPHLFLLDVVMPVMDGLELLRELNVKDNDYDAIMMTGHENLEHARKAMEYGALSYINKPIELEELDRQVAKALQNVFSRRQTNAFQDSLKKKVADMTRELKTTLEIAVSQSRRLDHIINSLSEGLLAIDNEENIMLMNHAAEEILKLTFAECLGSGISSVLSENVRANAQLLHYIRNIDPADTSDKILTIYSTRKGKQLFLVSIACMYSDDGQLIGKIINLIDHTERAKSERLKKTFLSNVSHEMRTPLTAIIGLTEILAAANDAERVEYLAVMTEAEHRLLNLIDGILNFSRLEKNKIVSEEVEFNIDALCKKKLSRFLPKASEKGLTMLLQVSPDIATHVFGDRIAIEQILSALIDNAIKFTETGSVTLAVSASETDHDRALYRFSVADTGIGIEQGKLQVIFEDFVQADESSTRKYTGIGLGLAIARGLTKVIGGKLRVESVVGAGSSFSLEVALEFFDLNTATDEQSVGSGGAAQNHSTVEPDTVIPHYPKQQEIGELSNFISTITHDLKNPLAGLESTLLIVKESFADTLGNEMREVIDTGFSSITYMRQLLTDLLDIAKRKTNGRTLVKETVDLQVMTNNTLTLLRNQLDEHSVVVVNTIGNNAGAILADVGELRKVFANLIGNAIAYSSTDAQPQITLRAAQHDGFCRVSITDNGLGIPPDDLPLIFDQFKRGSNVSHIKGTGLGLSIVKEIVEAHGGAIWCESRLSHGTTFHFTIPVSAQ
jgi:two-component system phosphate regulon sensor histidine kinase PhoR